MSEDDKLYYFDPWSFFDLPYTHTHTHTHTHTKGARRHTPIELEICVKQRTVLLEYESEAM